MILVGTSVWIEHLRTNHKALAGLLNRGAVLAHPFIIGEPTLGRILKQRRYGRTISGSNVLPTNSVWR